MTTSPLVTTSWLAERFAAPGIKIADASWYLPQAKRNPRSEYADGHIPGAVFIDIDAVSEQATNLPHMLPSAEAFARSMSGLGLSDSDTIVVYDGAGIYSAARVWWMLRAFGHSKVFVLDGGLPKWKQEGRPIEAMLPAVTPGQFTARLDTKFVRNFSAMLENLQSRTEQVLDARSPPRFRGEEAEPRPGVRPGHMPGALNLYYSDVLTAEGTMRAPAELKSLFAARGVDLTKPVVTSCGSGVTAAILTLALETAGVTGSALYDGSWSEWGARTEAPVVTGP